MIFTAISRFLNSCPDAFHQNHPICLAYGDLNNGDIRSRSLLNHAGAARVWFKKCPEMVKRNIRAIISINVSGLNRLVFVQDHQNPFGNCQKAFARPAAKWGSCDFLFRGWRIWDAFVGRNGAGRSQNIPGGKLANRFARGRS